MVDFLLEESYYGKEGLLPKQRERPLGGKHETFVGTVGDQRCGC